MVGSFSKGFSQGQSSGNHLRYFRKDRDEGISPSSDQIGEIPLKSPLSQKAKETLKKIEEWTVMSTKS